eukprot:g5520.t1
MGEPDADVLPEGLALDSKQVEPAAPAGASADQDLVTGQVATEDATEGTNGVTAGDDTVVDEVIDAADDFGGGRIIGRDISENGNEDEPSSRRGRRGRSRSRSRSRSRERAGASRSRSRSRDRGRRREERDRSRGRDRDRDWERDRDRDAATNGRDTRDRGRDDSRDRSQRDRGRGSSRDRGWGRDERDRARGRDRDSFDHTRDRGRQAGGQGHGRHDRGPHVPMDGGRSGGRDPFRGRGPPNNGPMMQQMGGNMPMMQPMGMPGAPMFPPQAAAHAQMVFTTTQRPQAKMGGQQTRTYNILPMISFKAFMAEQRDDVTPEECKQRYDEYKADYLQRLTHSFIDVHRKEEWFLERYHPKTEESKRYNKLKWIDQESAVFGKQLRANPRQFIASASLDPISEEERWGGVDSRKKHPRTSSREDTSVDDMEEDSERPGEPEPKNEQEDDIDYDVDAKNFVVHAKKVAFIRRIPAWVSTAELGLQIAAEAPKHERIVCSDAANTRNEDFGRSAYIIYDTPEKAAKAVQKLNKMRIYQTPKPKSKMGKKLSGADGRFFELKVFSYQPRSHTTVAPEFSRAERIVHDTKLSLKVAEALDAEFRRSDSADTIKALLAEPEVQAALASSPAGTAQLDLVCAYLKRVYFYLYYRGQQCRDEGDMISTRGAGRGTPAAPKEDIQAAMGNADSMEGVNGNGNGVVEPGAGSLDNSEADRPNKARDRKSETEAVDNLSAARIKQAEKADEKRQKDQAFVERYDARVQEEVSKWQAQHTGRTEEGYARCGMVKCLKLFKAPEFVHKHLVNKHPDKYKAVVDKVSDPFVREMFMADDNKPLPNIVADANTPPVVLLPGALGMGGAGAIPQGPPPMGVPGFPMMGGGMPMGPMGAMMPGQMGGMGDFPMQMPIPPDAMMGSAGRGFRGRGGGGFRGRGVVGGRFGGRGTRPEPTGPRDPRSLVSYVDVDAPKETTPDLDYGDAFPSKSRKKRKTM